nr:MAG TPA: hypothetical protein [Caudoviricetes sp.]DAV53364.1 MAG TPA: hypothetical protein [Caudoviricetes sp.]
MTNKENGPLYHTKCGGGVLFLYSKILCIYGRL